MLKYIPFIFLFLSLSFQANVNAFTAPQQHPDTLQLVAAEESIALADELPAITFGSTDAAKEIIHSIVSSVGLKPNFEIREGKISNAAAVIYKGKRFILYDAKFIQRIQNAVQTDWAAVSILAHEIGHHLNGHTLLGKGNYNVALELEADEFSGFILRQMGASLEDAQKALRLMSSVRESESHPGRDARMAAIEKGYISANERIIAYADQPKVHIAASVQPEKAIEKKKTTPGLAGESIYKEVHFNQIPDRTFYLTHELKLVAITKKGPAVLGNITKNGKRLVLNIHDRKSSNTSFYVSGKGKLVDEKNKVVGYITNPA